MLLVIIIDKCHLNRKSFEFLKFGKLNKDSMKVLAFDVLGRDIMLIDCES